MIYLSFAFLKEAEPYIQKYKLRKDMNHHAFPVYYNAYMTMIITGIGVVNASIGTTYMLSNYDINEEDIFVNIGIGGSNHNEYQIGDVILCNKIIQNWDKKCRYPDMLYQHPFNEASVETSMNVVDQFTTNIEGDVIEMEAAGIYKAASIYFPLHHMFFIKIISDKLDDVHHITEQKVYDLMDKTSEKIVSWLISVHDSIKCSNEGLDGQDLATMVFVKENMNLTENMYQQLVKLALYYKLRKNDLGEILKLYTEIEISNKNERKKYFEELRNKLKDA